MSIDLRLFQRDFTAILKGIAPLSAVVGAKIYNHVPECTAYPYLGFQINALENAPPKGGAACYAVGMRFDGQSQYAGDDEILAMHNALHDALHDKEFTLTGCSMDVVLFVNAQFTRGEDGITHLGSWVFTFFLTPTT